MEQYHSLVREVLENGAVKKDRTGVGTISIFGLQRKYDLQKGFPLITTKKVNYKAVLHELLWFLSGDTNIRYLVQNDVAIWNEWAFEGYLKGMNLVEQFPRYSASWKQKMAEFVEQVKTDAAFAEQWGELGPIYGKQWVRWEAKSGDEINQVQNVIDLIKNDPTSRRLIISGWNVGEIQELIHNHHLAPPSCHTLFQFCVIDGRLDLQLYQRSADIALGVPFNIACYATFLTMMAQECGLKPGIFIHTLGDAHIYLNHVEGLKKQLERKEFPLPTLKIASKPFWDLKYEDFALENYQHQPFIKFEVAV